MKLSKKTSIIFIFIIFSVENLFFISSSFGMRTEVTSSMTPVGSGARASGIGSAFIAVANDATAASWNPAGLSLLDKPEFSMVISNFHTKEKIEFKNNPEGNSVHKINDLDVNYLSLVYPFIAFNNKVTISLSYQNLYSFNRNWNFALEDQGESSTLKNSYEYNQSGNLSAIGLSCSLALMNKPNSKIFMGLTFNIWDNHYPYNYWRQNYVKFSVYELQDGRSTSDFLIRKHDFSFSAYNMNIGLLWKKKIFSLGFVLKTHVDADIEQNITKYRPSKSPSYEKRIEEMRLPGVVGAGFSYKLNESFLLSADIYLRDWSEYFYKNNDGIKFNPVSGELFHTSPLNSTIHFRTGMEYVFASKPYFYPVRFGLFYDPSPAVNNQDDYYGFSGGIGFVYNNVFAFDIAYTVRYGKDVGQDMLSSRRFSQDVTEQYLYMSVIWYYNFFK